MIAWLLGAAMATVPLSDEAARPDLDGLLGPTVTAATKRAQLPQDVPATVVILTSEDIAERGYEDLVDLLADLPGVTPTWNLPADFGATRFGVRGIANNAAIAVLLDGRRLAFAPRIARDAVMTRDLPLAMVERVEIAYGPAAALYGADALGMVVNLVSRDARNGDRVDVYGSASPDGQIAGAQAESLLGGEGSGFAGVRFLGESGDGLPDPEDPRSTAARAAWPGSSVRDTSLRTNTELASFRGHGFSIALLRQARDLPMFGEGDDAVAASNDRSRWQEYEHTVLAGFDAPVGGWNTSTELGYDVVALDPNSSYGYNQAAPDVDFTERFHYGMGRSWRLEETLARDLTPDLSLVGGLTAEDVSAVPLAADLTSPAVPTGGPGARDLDTVQYQNYGAYMQVQLGYVPHLQTILGMRVDYNTRYAPAWTPRAGLVWAPAEGTLVKALYGSAFLAPTLTQSFLSYGDPGSLHGVSNTELRPQTAKMVEVGVEQALAGGVVSASAYQTILADAIEEVTSPAPDLTQVRSYQNIGVVSARGLELGAGRRFGSVDAKASLSLLQDREDLGGGDVDDVAGTVGVLARGRVTWRPWPGVSVSPAVWWESGFSTTDDKGFNGLPMPPAWGLDLALRWKLDGGLELTLRGTNLLDAAYFAPGATPTQPTALRQPGRRLQAEVRYGF